MKVLKDYISALKYDMGEDDYRENDIDFANLEQLNEFDNHFENIIVLHDLKQKKK